MRPLTKTAIVRHERARDAGRIEALLDQSFGADRRESKTVYRLRDGVEPVRALSYVVEYRRAGEDESNGAAAEDLAATIRYWPVLLPSGAGALLLGPVAVDAARKNEGIGANLLGFSMDQARALGYAALLLVGDAPYYGKFGFTRAPARGLMLPGPVDEDRFLGLEWTAGALGREAGLIRKWPAGRPPPHEARAE